MTTLSENPDIQKLPEGVQNELAEFMKEIPKTNFFKPDRKPKKEWEIK